MRQGGQNMAYTFGYIREATQAHLDLDEQEAQAMRLHERYYIYANEAMQAICSVKPKYDYFNCEIVKDYAPLIKVGENQFRLATPDELNWVYLTPTAKPNFADRAETISWYESQNVYLLNRSIRMPDDFIAFAEKQAWAFIRNDAFNPELFVRGYYTSPTSKYKQVKIGKTEFAYTGSNAVLFHKEGTYQIPYKATWHRFRSNTDDDTIIDMPVDILLTIPLYIASQCLYVDNAQKAIAKRAEFEAALARCSNTDFLEMKSPSVSFK